MISDKRIIHTYEELIDFNNTFYNITQLLLEELAEYVLTYKFNDKIKQDYLLQSLARLRVQIKSIILLFELKHYSDVNILMRNMAEKLLTLHYLVDNNSFGDFYNFTIVSNFETRNKVKSDTNCKEHLNTAFWTESKERIKTYSSLKSNKTKWARPSPSLLESVAKQHNLIDIYKYCYKLCSGFVHPTYFDGAEEFIDFTNGLENIDDFHSRISYLNNSTLMSILTFELIINELEGKKNPLVFSFITSCFDFIQNKNLKFKSDFSNIENIKFIEKGVLFFFQ